jgi:acyl dehydratase
LVTARDIELFTEITGDRNPLHYDEQRAAASRFEGIIVQGGRAGVTSLGPRQLSASWSMDTTRPARSSSQAIVQCGARRRCVADPGLR